MAVLGAGRRHRVVSRARSASVAGENRGASTRGAGVVEELTTSPVMRLGARNSELLGVCVVYCVSAAPA